LLEPSSFLRMEEGSNKLHQDERPEKIEFSILRKEEGSNKLHQDILEEDQVQKYLDVIVEEEKQKAEAEKAKQKS